MQEFFSNKVTQGAWSEPTGVLGELTAAAHTRAAAISGKLSSYQDQARNATPALSFTEALRGANIRVIAEVKRASPSKGSIAPGLDAVAQAAAYVSGGAAAISVLTEPSRFSGSMDDLLKVSAAVRVPVIRKDFIVHPVQLWEARANGASAALLIARALSPNLLPQLVEQAFEAGLEPLVEIRSTHELDRALQAGARVIGVNNRNLETLVIDPATAPRIIAEIPADRIAVAESGMKAASDVEPARNAGADAILVGSAISASSDPTASVREFSSIVRHALARHPMPLPRARFGSSQQ